MPSCNAPHPRYFPNSQEGQLAGFSEGHPGKSALPPASQLPDGLKELLHSNFNDNSVSQWEQKIGEMISEETSTLERLNRQQITEALKGDSPDYFTLWESRN